MSQDDLSGYGRRGARQSRGASALAENAVSLLSKRQAMTTAGARQFILDHLLRAVTSRNEFDSCAMLDELRGHRLSVDSVIDIYVPAIARILGEMWEESEIDFASVTVGSMRLQSLLSIASSEALDFLRPVEDSYYMLVAVPEGEQHSLGAFVLAAQLRRLGARVEVSFCESPSEFVSRVICDTPHMILFSASCKASLATVSQLVLDTCNVVTCRPLIAMGGPAALCIENGMEISGIDLITDRAKVALSFVAEHQGRSSERADK